MDAAIAETAIKVYLKKSILVLMRQPASRRRPTPARKPANPDKGVHVVMDIEQLVYEATRLLDAATLLNRLAKET